MAQRRLTDSELANKVRASNVRRAERRRERLALAGYVQTVVWLPQSTRTALDARAAERNATLSDTTTALLSMALNAPPSTAPAAYTRSTAPVPQPVPVDAAPAPKPSTVDLTPDQFGEPAPPATAPTAPIDRDELMREIGEMFDKGLLGVDIARRLNASGRRTARGKEFQGANVLRDFRAWREKNRTVDATKEPT